MKTITTILLLVVVAIQPTKLHAGGSFPGKREVIRLKPNVEIQSQFKTANCTYRVCRDVYLMGARVVIPENCTIRFVGGCFKNGFIVCQGTELKGKKIRITPSPDLCLMIMLHRRCIL